MAITHNLLPRIIKSGLGVLSPAVGVRAFARALATHGFTACQLVVSPFQWAKLMAGATSVYPIFSEYAHFKDRLETTPSTRGGIVASAPLEQSRRLAQQAVLDGVTTVVQELLGSSVSVDQVRLKYPSGSFDPPDRFSLLLSPFALHCSLAPFRRACTCLHAPM